MTAARVDESTQRRDSGRHETPRRHDAANVVDHEVRWSGEEPLDEGAEVVAVELKLDVSIVVGDHSHCGFELGECSSEVRLEVLGAMGQEDSKWHRIRG